MTEIKQAKKKNPVTAFLPALGLIGAVVLGYLGWFLAPYLLDWTVEVAPGFTGNELDPLIMRIIFAAFIFFVAGGAMSFLISLARPRKKGEVKEAALRQERQQRLADKRKRKKMTEDLARRNRDQYTSEDY